MRNFFFQSTISMCYLLLIHFYLTLLPNFIAKQSHNCCWLFTCWCYFYLYSNSI